MPELRVLSWNSTGENVVKGIELTQAQASLAGMYVTDHPAVDVFLIQEARNTLGGAIYAMMNTDPATPTTQASLGPVINRPPDHCTELITGGGAGYLCCTDTSVKSQIPLHLWNYTNDLIVNHWINTLNPKQRAAMIAATTQRPPTYSELSMNGIPIFLITWHSPIGPSPLNGETMQGGGLIDSFLVLEQSALFGHAQNYVGQHGVIIIAGDLNTTAAGLAFNDYYGIGYQPLTNFTGFSHHLDHILAWKPGGNGVVNVTQGHHNSSSSVHDMLSARIDW